MTLRTPRGRTTFVASHFVLRHQTVSINMGVRAVSVLGVKEKKAHFIRENAVL